MDSTVFRVIKNRNYTTLSNIPLFDKNLSLKSKGLISQMLALPPTWDYTMSGLATINPDGRVSIRTALTELEERGYLFRFQSHENGRLGKNVYYIFENPEVNPFFHLDKKDLNMKRIKEIAKTIEESTLLQSAGFLPTENLLTENLPAENPLTENLPTEKQPSENQLAENRPQLSTNKLTTNKTSTNLSITKESKIDMMRYDELKEQIMENVEFDYYLANYPASVEEISEIVELIVEMMLTRDNVVIVGKRSYDAELIRNRLSNFTSEHMDYLLRSLKDARPSINNITNYLKTAIINATVSISNEASTTLRSIGII